MFICSAAVTGATFPGKASAHLKLIFSSSTALTSTPPGFDAKSIIKHPFFTYLSLSFVSINVGGVFIIISYSLKLLAKLFINFDKIL